MSEKWRYLLVERGPIYDALVDWKRRRLEAQRAMMAFAAEFGAKGILVGFKGELIGISPVHPTPDGWKVAGRRHDRLYPKMSTTLGKEIEKRIKALDRQQTADEVVDLIGMPTGYRWKEPGGAIGSYSYLGYAIEPLQVGWESDVFVLLVPDHDAILAEFRAEHPAAIVDPGDIWTVPAGLTPISKARWDLIVAQAAVAREEAKAAA